MLLPARADGQSGQRLSKSSEPFELVHWDAFVLQHYRDVIIDTVNPLAVLCDQAFAERRCYWAVVGSSDFAPTNSFIDYNQLLAGKNKDWLLADWAAQDLQQFSVNGHGLA